MICGCKTDAKKSTDTISLRKGKFDKGEKMMDMSKHWPMILLAAAVILILVLIVTVSRKPGSVAATASLPAEGDIQGALSSIQATCESLGFIRPSVAAT